ncbi:MAG: thioredoxin fold domain-containing protein [Saprospiraceae bacterium]|nr:thioredoxin fold domain-containing protein [Saprospiraceae bacterium]
MAEAKATNQNIFVDAYTTWCAPCKKMSKYVFTKPEVGAFYNDKFISIKLDMEEGEGKAFAAKYQVKAYPTLLYFSPDGELLHKVAGYKDADDFLETAKTAMNPGLRLGSLTKRYLEGERSPEFLKDYAYASKAAADVKYRQIAEAYLNTQSEWSSAENMQFIFDFTENTRSRHFNYMIDNRALFEEKFGNGPVFNKVQSIVENHLDLIMNQKGGDITNELDDADKLFQKVYKEDATVKFAAFRMTYFRTQGDRDGFAQAAVDYVENMKNITADELNSIARTFAEVIDDKAMLSKAVEWSKRAIEMENAYTNHYTLAALYYKLDKRWKAKKTAKKAIRLATKQGEDPVHVQDLLKAIKGKHKAQA